MLSCGASGGKKLFDGLELTAKFFYDALSIPHAGSLTYRYIESPSQMASHPTAKEDIKKSVKNLCDSFISKKNSTLL